MKTIIDILNRGNLELFHSSMIAWLLDENGEHGLNTTVLSALATKLAERGFDELKAALEGGVANLATEVRRGRHRYDIHLELDDRRVVFENKTKSVGNSFQLDAYGEDGSIVVALGLCSESYEKEVEDGYPMIDYFDLLEALKRTTREGAQHNPFQILVDQYICYLERELEVIKTVRKVVTDPDCVDRNKLAETVKADLYNENDRRFWNLILLEQYRRELTRGHPLWKDAGWYTYKNDRSGVWLADGNKNVPPFRDSLVRCKEQFRANTWFHVELYENALATLPDDIEIGRLQLKAEVRAEKGKNRDFADAFFARYPIEGNIIRSGNIRENAGTFYLAAKPLYPKDLSGTQIPVALTNFAKSFQTE